jgi:hypothetical protein
MVKGPRAACHYTIHCHAALSNYTVHHIKNCNHGMLLRFLRSLSTMWFLGLTFTIFLFLIKTFSNLFLLLSYVHSKIYLKLAAKWTTSTVSGTLVILCWETCHLLWNPTTTPSVVLNNGGNKKRRKEEKKRINYLKKWPHKCWPLANTLRSDQKWKHLCVNWLKNNFKVLPIKKDREWERQIIKWSACVIEREREKDCERERER